MKKLNHQHAPLSEKARQWHANQKRLDPAKCMPPAELARAQSLVAELTNRGLATLLMETVAKYEPRVLANCLPKRDVLELPPMSAADQALFCEVLAMTLPELRIRQVTLAPAGHA